MSIKKPRPSCKFCGKEGKRHTLIYCSNACQLKFERAKRIANWLATGQAKDTRAIKKYLLDSQLNSCAICGHYNIWNNQELVFVLDHITGDSSNNRRENLRLVCPNCDSQLPTFKSRNRGNGRHNRRERYKQGKSY